MLNISVGGRGRERAGRGGGGGPAHNPTHSYTLHHNVVVALRERHTPLASQISAHEVHAPLHTIFPVTEPTVRPLLHQLNGLVKSIRHSSNGINMPRKTIECTLEMLMAGCNIQELEKSPSYSSLCHIHIKPPHAIDF